MNREEKCDHCTWYEVDGTHAPDCITWSKRKDLSDAKTIEELRNRCETYENEVNMLRGQRSDEERKNQALRKWCEELERTVATERALAESVNERLEKAESELSAARVDAEEARALLQHAQYIAMSDLCAVGHAQESRARTESMDGLRKWVDRLERFLCKTLASQSGEKHG